MCACVYIYKRWQSFASQTCKNPSTPKYIQGQVTLQTVNRAILTLNVHHVYQVYQKLWDTGQPTSLPIIPKNYIVIIIIKDKFIEPAEIILSLINNSGNELYSQVVGMSYLQT